MKFDPKSAATLGKRLRRAWIEAQDRPYERRLGIRTGLVTEALSNPVVQAEGHMATPYRVLDGIAAHLDANRIAAPRFVDAGCGLGRPLYYFAGRFEELQGFEIAASLHARALEQLAVAVAANPSYARITIDQADATLALPLDRPMVLFLYNPFGPWPMARLCERLRAAAHEIHLYYANPVREGVLAAALGRPADARLRGWFETSYWRIAPA